MSVSLNVFQTDFYQFVYWLKLEISLLYQVEVKKIDFNKVICFEEESLFRLAVNSIITDQKSIDLSKHRIALSTPAVSASSKKFV